MKRTGGALVLALGLLCGTGCTVGDGSGQVTSDRLYVKGCWNGPFDLKPDFFAANPYRDEQLMIRVQRGDNNVEASDGLSVLVNDLKTLKTGQDIQVGLPNGVAPPGQPLTGAPNPQVSLSLYLHQTCHEQNSATYSVSGTINFKSIFSGDPNEEDSEKRLTEAEFHVQFADPRELGMAETDEDKAKVTSEMVDGKFHFFFQRGQPAQPFQ